MAASRVVAVFLAPTMLVYLNIHTYIHIRLLQVVKRNHTTSELCCGARASMSRRDAEVPRSTFARTLLHVLLSKLRNSVTPLPSSGLYTG